MGIPNDIIYDENSNGIIKPNETLVSRLGGKPVKTLMKNHKNQGSVVQSIVSLTSSLIGQLVKCFTTLLPNTLIFFDEKNERSFCTAKATHIFSTKNNGIFQILMFEILTKR